MESMPSPDEMNHAMQELDFIQGRILQTGAVDTEIDMLDEIREKLMKMKLLPEDAVRKARQIESGRQDYH
jgi:hypothetical protein